MPDQMRSYLDFEKPVAELEAKVDELRALAASGSDIGDEIGRIEDKAQQALADLYDNLTPWQKTLVARHPSVRTSPTSSTRCSPNSPRWRATASSPRTRR